MESDKTDTIPPKKEQEAENSDNVAANIKRLSALKSIRQSIDLNALKGRMLNASANGNADEKGLNLIDRAIQINEQLAGVKSIKDTAGWFTISEAEGICKASLEQKDGDHDNECPQFSLSLSFISCVKRWMIHGKINPKENLSPSAELGAEKKASSNGPTKPAKYNPNSKLKRRALNEIRARSKGNADLFEKLCEIRRRFLHQVQTMNYEHSGKDNKKKRFGLMKALKEEKAKLEEEARVNSGAEKVTKAQMKKNSKKQKPKTGNVQQVAPERITNKSDEREKIPDVGVNTESDFEVVSTYSNEKQVEQKSAFYNKGSLQQESLRKRGQEAEGMVGSNSKKAKYVEHSTVLGVPNAVLKGIPECSTQTLASKSNEMKAYK